MESKIWRFSLSWLSGLFLFRVCMPSLCWRTLTRFLPQTKPRSACNFSSVKSFIITFQWKMKWKGQTYWIPLKEAYLQTSTSHQNPIQFGSFQRQSISQNQSPKYNVFTPVLDCVPHVITNNSLNPVDWLFAKVIVTSWCGGHNYGLFVENQLTMSCNNLPSIVQTIWNKILMPF